MIPSIFIPSTTPHFINFIMIQACAITRLNIPHTVYTKIIQYILCITAGGCIDSHVIIMLYRELLKEIITLIIVIINWSFFPWILDPQIRSCLTWKGNTGILVTSCNWAFSIMLFWFRISFFYSFNTSEYYRCRFL